MKISLSQIAGFYTGLKGVTPGLEWQRAFIKHNILAVIRELGGAERRTGFYWTERSLSDFASPCYRLGTVCIKKGKGRRDSFFVFRAGVFVHECERMHMDGRICSIETLAYLWQTVGFLLRLYLQQTNPGSITFHPLDSLQSLGMAGDALTKHMTSHHMIESSGLKNGALRSYTDAVVMGSRLVRFVYQRSLAARITAEDIARCVES